MRRILLRFPSLVARNFVHSPIILRHSKINPCFVPSLDRVTSRFVFFSSESDSARRSRSDQVVSKEELKKRIQSFLDDGDEDALPDLFEAMMHRQLSGKHDDSDDELMEEVRKYPVNDAHKVDDADSDVESDDPRDGDSPDSDVESDGLRDGDSSDSDIEFDGLKDGDSSDSDVESDGLKDVDLSGLDIKIDGLNDFDLSNLDIKIDGLKDVDLSNLGIKLDGLKRDHLSYSDSESD